MRQGKPILGDQEGNLAALGARAHGRCSLGVRWGVGLKVSRQSRGAGGILSTLSLLTAWSLPRHSAASRLGHLAPQNEMCGEGKDACTIAGIMAMIKWGSVVAVDRWVEARRAHGRLVSRRAPGLFLL